MDYFVTVIAILYLSMFGIVSAQFQRQSDCNTPNEVAGNCIIIRQCIPLLTMLQEKPLRPETVDYLTRSQCGFEGKDPRVCCPLPANQIESNRINQPSYPRTIPPTEETRGGLETADNTISNLLDNPLLPSECGKSLIPRIIGGTRTALDEFPWMALLEYQHPRGRTTACGGVLINERYVLTAAHCLKGKDLPSTWTLTSVRLGEYDTSSDKDCIQEEDEVICSDDPITVGIEEQIAHEQYRPLSKDQKYDIALLRLSRNIVSTEYIKPICLPRTPSFGQKMYVAGWGKTEFNSSSDFKLKLALPLTDKDDCDRTYNQVGIRLGFGQICAGGQKGKDSCRGDSGGPLMSVENLSNGNGIWAAVGIVSFGPTPCGMPGWPGVYTKVYDFVPWITKS
ncbi:CLIP domain-containing serine protease 2-like [Vespula squamosa]|uniref:CLIP domain-containing serine protease n=1 Tax=Vespula squamosa TaxID=30214 RepID=A0ABD2APU4_VESSQ